MAEPDINNTTRVRTKNAGNGLAASTLIPAGSLIIQISNPYLVLLEKAHLDSTCSWCFLKSENDTLKSCTACKVIRYCSHECQKKDWKAIHKKECKILQTTPDVLPTPTRGLLQLALRHTPKDDEPDPRLMGLVVNDTHLIEAGRFDELSLQAIVAAKYSGREEAWMYTGAKLMCQMSSNAFRVTLPDDTPIGLCFEPTLALANHSCSPNATVIFDGRTVSFRALSDIKQGEEILISYIDPTQPLEKRRKELEHQYFFTCQCLKCSKNENAYETFLRLCPSPITTSTSTSPRRLINLLIDPTSLKSTAQKASTTYKTLFQHPNIGRNFASTQEPFTTHLSTTTDMPALTRLSFLQNLYSRHSFQIPAISPNPNILQEIYLCHLDEQTYLPALICLLSLALHSDPFAYLAVHHPVRVVRLFTIAKLLKHLSTLNPVEFREELEKLDADVQVRVREIMSLIKFMDVLEVLLGIVGQEVGKSHGVASKFAREVEEEIKDLREGRRRMEGGKNSGEALKRWMSGENDVEGAKAATDVIKVLWKLANCVEGLLGVPL